MIVTNWPIDGMTDQLQKKNKKKQALSIERLKLLTPAQINFVSS